MENKPLIAVPMGDPAGVGPEISIKATGSKIINEKAGAFIIGSKSVAEKALKYDNMPDFRLNVIENPEKGIYEEGIVNLIDLNNIHANDYEVGRVNAKCGRASYEFIEKSIGFAMKGIAKAVSTTPINKESLRAAQVPYIGHTEIFGALTKSQDPLTIFELKHTLVFFLTRHMSLRNACDAITKERIIDYVVRSFDVMHKFGMKNPSMAIAGLNPHSGEHGLFGDEEVREIFPAVSKLQEMGFNVVGPIGADSVFYQAFEGRFDSVLSLYHDQGHIATKSVDFYRTISITGGMPILRTSVDHGTAFDIAGKGIATSAGMEEAILVAAEYAPFYR